MTSVKKENCQPFMILLVQAPSKLTTFRCAPKWIIIFNSPTKASRAATFVCERTILTATVLTDSSQSLTPTASALTTRPKHPAPSCTPSLCKIWCHFTIQNGINRRAALPSFKRFLGNSHRTSYGNISTWSSKHKSSFISLGFPLSRARAPGNKLFFYF